MKLSTGVCRQGPGYCESHVHFRQVGMKSVKETAAGNIETDMMAAMMANEKMVTSTQHKSQNCG
ncbi:hypothetical protein SCLCIDRAFT_1219058 [Scleroderma citrinum Foug A]|uniref:Uncharacterized protein n=1 Tax=Scleroderma citrinum Foug A TaxID=1036808 RepID=A0A0C3DP77_9AGAM|nr:hypothetical protein SCLCIDRAFT_1219053 [Scleroderma citrinum Foug A]KIM57804.1 hypothetical protein SCLCIDRAFT_1219058 [Scleroderma citrinum Foug A]